MLPDAREEVVAEDLVPANDFYHCFSSTQAGDFYKPNTLVICAAHIVGITDQAMHCGEYTEDNLPRLVIWRLATKASRPLSFATVSSNISAHRKDGGDPMAQRRKSA